MQASLRLFGLGCAVVVATACGGTGSDAPVTPHNTAGAAGAAGAGTAGAGAAGAGTAGAGTAGAGTAGAAPTCTSGSVSISTMMTFDDDKTICSSTDVADAMHCWKPLYTSAGTGVTPIAVSAITTSFDNMDDATMPAPATLGSLMAVIPYTSAAQYAGLGMLLPMTGSKGVDMSGRIVHAHVQVQSGIDTPANISTGSGVKIYAKSGMGYRYVNGTYTNAAPVGTWQEITLDMCNPEIPDDGNTAVWDPTDVREIGIQFDCSMAAMMPQTGTVLIDNFEY